MVHLGYKLFQSLWYELKLLEKPVTIYEFEESYRFHGSVLLNLHKAVWVHRKISPLFWIPFLYRNIDRMTSSQELYVIYTNFVLYHTVICKSNPFDQFVSVCSLITAIAELCSDVGHPEVLSYSPNILEVFFDRVLKEAFDKHGGWEGLQEYILKQNYLKFYGCKELSRNGQKIEEKLQQELNFAKYILKKVSKENKVFSTADFNENEVESDRVSLHLTSEFMNL
ncbi:hypothetical protein NPIL_637591 [Nephila pilipes]|uniref:Uncharacterized protein n=1 Tax=Nephila pilipes TaxID=299642 RepID=A0A8X6U9G4_NEPPI|nr:hypothetical protein NPIL_637591 [Nephila pilipes]